jgi:uncharacterized protein involved in exopolysaccharide biosynthesis
MEQAVPTETVKDTRLSSDTLGVALARATAVVARHARLFIALVVLAVMLSVLNWYMNGRGYVAESRFRPSTGGGDMSRLSGIAAQFGIDGLPTSEKETIDFYAELSKSREILGPLVLKEYRFAETLEPNADTVTGTIVKLYDIREKQPQRGMIAARQRLADDVSVSTNLKANLVTVRVTAPWPKLAEQLNRDLLNEVNKFNLEKRQSQGSAERSFVQAQLRQAQNELTAAENELEQFLLGNRRFDKSTSLTFDRERLQRRVELRQQVYASLAQSFEKAKIDEVRNTPVITIVEGPETSARPNGSLIRSILLGLVPGTIVALALVFFLDHLQQAKRARPEEFVMFDGFRRRVARQR